MSTYTDEDLKAKLLSIGGTEVAFPRAGEIDLDRIVSRGHLTRGSDSRRVAGGAPISCHSNSAELWEKNKDTLSIETGYALSSDGVWRQHSWVAWKDQPGILETTVATKKRVAYFGFPMTDTEAEDFAKLNPSRKWLKYTTLEPPDPREERVAHSTKRQGNSVARRRSRTVHPSTSLSSMRL